MTTVFAGDIGTKIILDCKTDVTLSSVRQIVVRKPVSGARVVLDADLEGSDSIQYTTVAGDLDEVGNWRLQAYIEMPNWQGSGEVVVMAVNRPL